MFGFGWFRRLFTKKPKASEENTFLALPGAEQENPDRESEAGVFGSRDVALIAVDADLLRALMKRGGQGDPLDLINSTFTAYSWMLDSLNEGRIIASINVLDDSYRELELPAFKQLKTQIPWGTWIKSDEDDAN